MPLGPEDLHRVDDVAPEREQGHVVPARDVRGDDAIGAGLAQTIRRLRLAGASDDEDPRVQRASRQRDVDVRRVGVHRADEGLGPLDPRLAEQRLRRRVAHHVEDPVAAELVLERLVRLEHHEGDALLAEITRHGPPDPSIGADDHVIAELLDPSFHASSPGRGAELSVGHRAGHDRQDDDERGDAEHRDGNREQAGRVGQLARGVEPRGRERERRHEQGSHEVEPEQQVPDDPVGEDQDDREQRPAQAPPEGRGRGDRHRAQPIRPPSRTRRESPVPRSPLQAARPTALQSEEHREDAVGRSEVRCRTGSCG
ncbi:MAG: hypothetical protein KatS3mg013_0599 [Actinomycetota bacterium]|nr:MAG: hypothetical protein KatS3mg013_0599 [Actinomycetota bacterium]